MRTGSCSSNQIKPSPSLLFQFASSTVRGVPGKTRVMPKERVITPSVNVRSPCNSVIVNRTAGGFEETPGSDADPPQHFQSLT